MGYKWMRGRELMDRWNINYLKLLDLVSKSKITAYTEDGQEIDPKKPFNWKAGSGSAEMRVQSFCFLKSEVNYYEQTSPMIIKNNNLSKEVKLRQNQRHKLEVIEIAKSIWAKNPNTTIRAIAELPEITNIKKKDGKSYKEKTIREWIKYDCPNRNPGRRPRT